MIYPGVQVVLRKRSLRVGTLAAVTDIVGSSRGGRHTFSLGPADFHVVISISSHETLLLCNP